MADNETRAKATYDSIVAYLNAKDWHFEEDAENLVIRSGIKGEDLPIQFILHVNARSSVVQFISSLPFQMPEDMRIDGAVAVAVANYGMVNGSFDYDLSDGEIRFRLTTAYDEGEFDAKLVDYMIGVGASTVDSYNDRFFMLAKKMLTVEDFIAKEKA